MQVQVPSGGGAAAAIANGGRRSEKGCAHGFVVVL
jgi:hypothetical protein